LDWLTYLGGNGSDAVYDLALGDGALYAAGTTNSTDFPGARPVTGDQDGFAVAISLDGTALYYSSLLGGSDQESAYALTVEDDQAVVTGISYSTDFSTSPYFGAGDVFVARLDASGTPLFIKLFGGRGVDAGFDIASQNGDTWVVGQTFSFNFPARGLKGAQDGFVLRLDSDGVLKWGSLVGGSGEDNAQGLALDESGNAYVTGLSASSDFPSGGTLYGRSDTYLAQLAPDGSLSQSVRVGGTADELGRTVALDGSGRVLLCGLTSSDDFPVTANAAQNHLNGGEDAFIASFNAAALAAPDQYYGTFYGGNGDEACNGVVSADSGSALFVGESDSSGSPAAFSKIGPGGANDGIIAMIVALPPGIVPAATATTSSANPTDMIVLTPTIPLVYTPQPKTTTPTTNVLQSTVTATDSLSLAQTQVATVTVKGSPAPITQTNIPITLTKLPIETGSEKTPGGWWIGGIAALLVFAGGGWLFIRKIRR